MEEARGGRYEMYIVFFLYLGFNLLNIYKTAPPDSSLCEYFCSTSVGKSMVET